MMRNKIITPMGKISVFGISWIDKIDIDDQSEEMIARDTQTWFGADPTLCIEQK